MSTVHVNGIDLYYEEHGEGEPLLLIMGWGGNAATWKPQLPGLAERFRVIVFDNRGVARSSSPKAPYSTPQMAEDTLGLLDALDVARAHVFGISMGGMVAQEFALAHPERVDALILGCTSAGGNRSAGFADLRGEIADFHELSEDGGPDLQWFSEFLQRLWTDEALARYDRHLQDFLFSMIRFPPPTHGMRNQAKAIAGHNAYDRLIDIRRPTLVITGEEDGLIHPLNSLALAERIPSGELRLFPELKHAFHLERPDLVNPTIIEFIERVRRPGVSATPASRIAQEPS